MPTALPYSGRVLKTNPSKLFTVFEFCFHTNQQRNHDISIHKIRFLKYNHDVSNKGGLGVQVCADNPDTGGGGLVKLADVILEH